MTTGQPHRHEVVACLGSPPPDVVAVLGPDSDGTTLVCSKQAGRGSLLVARVRDHLMVSDVGMLRLGNVGPSEQRERQGLVGRVLYTSDCLDQATGADGAAVDTEKLLPESFRPEELLNRVRAVPDG